MKPQTYTTETAGAQPETRGFKETSGQMIQRLCNELNTVTAQRDELLAALKDLLAIVGVGHYHQYPQQLTAAHTAISKAE